jgi:hypothetical protein
MANSRRLARVTQFSCVICVCVQSKGFKPMTYSFMRAFLTHLTYTTYVMELDILPFENNQWRGFLYQVVLWLGSKAMRTFSTLPESQALPRIRSFAESPTKNSRQRRKHWTKIYLPRAKYKTLGKDFFAESQIKNTQQRFLYRELTCWLSAKKFF